MPFSDKISAQQTRGSGVCSVVGAVESARINPSVDTKMSRRTEMAFQASVPSSIPRYLLLVLTCMLQVSSRIATKDRTRTHGGSRNSTRYCQRLERSAGGNRQWFALGDWFRSRKPHTTSDSSVHLELQASLS